MENVITKKKTLFAFAKSLNSFKNVFKGKDQPKTFAQLTPAQQKIVKKKFEGKMGDEYRKQLAKTVKPGKGKLSLPSQKPGTVGAGKPPTIKPASNTKKIKPKAGGNKSRWLTHVAEFREKNPGMAYKEVLIEAKKTYQTNRAVKRAAPKKKVEKQVGVVKVAKSQAEQAAPAPKKLKARKLNKKQMLQRWHRIVKRPSDYKTEKGEASRRQGGKYSLIFKSYIERLGGDGFDEFYEEKIKGKRFTDNEELEQFIMEGAKVQAAKDKVAEDKYYAEQKVLEEKRDIENETKHKDILGRIMEFYNIDMDKAEELVKYDTSNDTYLEKYFTLFPTYESTKNPDTQNFRYSSVYNYQDFVENRGRTDQQRDIDVERIRKEEEEAERVAKIKRDKKAAEALANIDADKKSMTKDGEDHFASGEGKEYVEGLPRMPYFYVKVFEKNYPDIIRRLKKYKNKKSGTNYLQAEKAYMLNLREYEWDTYTDLPEDQQTDFRAKEIKSDIKSIKREYKEKIKKARQSKK